MLKKPMSVTNLFLKIVSGEPMQSQEQMQLERGVGIVGNKYSGAYTPRQILITRLQTLEKYNLAPGDLRENIVVSDFPVDELRSGQVIKIGNADIRISFSCEPCAFVERLQTGLLRKVEGERGVLGVVCQSGTIKLDDEITILKNEQFPLIPYKIPDRFAWLVAQIPVGKVISYKQIIETLGLWNSVYRALPAFMRRLDPDKYPVHRIVSSAGELLPQLADQKEQLAAEHIEIINGTVNLQSNAWDTANLYLRTDIGAD